MWRCAVRQTCPVVLQLRALQSQNIRGRSVGNVPPIVDQNTPPYPDAKVFLTLVKTPFSRILVETKTLR
jgi:hypothetical protein